MRSAPKTRSGFTLIEVALASTIIVVGFIGMVAALAIGSEMLDTARKQTIAAQIIQSEIDYLRLQDWDTVLKNLSNQSQVPLTTALDNPLSSGCRHLYGTSLASLPYRSLTYGWQVTNVRTDSSGNPVLRQVTITVSWASITGKPHSRSSVTYIGKYGLNVSYQKS
jgi:uncharacterized protein (TIGR02598 family)